MTSSERNWDSPRGVRAGSPVGLVMATPWTMRGAPTFLAKSGSAVISTAGMPARSISFASVAPQRVPVPQVAVSRTMLAPAPTISLAISAPNCRARAMGAVMPVVTK